MATEHNHSKTTPHHRIRERPAPPVCSCQPVRTVRWREEQLQRTSAGRQRISKG